MGLFVKVKGRECVKVCEDDGICSVWGWGVMVCEGNGMFKVHILVRLLDVYWKNGGKFTI